MNPYASRKFVLALLSLASATWLVWEKVITTGDYKAVLLGTVGSYIAGNVVQKFTASNTQVTP